MPDFTTLTIFAGAAFVLAVTPGPDVFLIASRSLTQGKLAGLLTCLGISAGYVVHTVLAALGLSKLFLTVPIAFEIVRWAGCAYLLYLAWKALGTKTPEGEVVTTPPIAPMKTFMQGLLTNLLNPKVALFILALFPQFVHPNEGSVLVQMMVLALVLNVITLAINSSVIVLGSRIRARLSRPRRFPRLPQYLMATVFAGLACRLALTQRA